VLVAKLVLTPLIVVLATLAGRRFGRVASGWLIGLPLTSGPITAFFAIEHGPHFAARAAVGSLGGAVAEVGFCFAYAVAGRRRRWPSAVAAGSLCFAATATLLDALPLDARSGTVAQLTVAASASLVIGLALLPDVAAGADRPDRLPSRWDLPARAAAATGFLLALTAVATSLGPRLSGLLAVYPLYTVVLAAFAQRLDGPTAAVQVLRGLLVGLFSFVCFFATLAVALGRLSTPTAFALAFAAALGVQALSLRPLLRMAGPAGSRVTLGATRP
jgi:hypothetical protein